MHSQQKVAWFVLIVIGGTLVLYGAAVPVLSWWFHRTLVEAALPALGLFGLTGLIGFVPLFFRSSRSKGPGNKPVMDERDWMLSRQAWRAGMTSFWLLLWLTAMGTWTYFYFLRHLEWVTVPIGIFPGMLFGGAIIMMLTRSLATLHFYGWKANDAGR